MQPIEWYLSVSVYCLPGNVINELSISLSNINSTGFWVLATEFHRSESTPIFFDEKYKNISNDHNSI